MNAVAPPIRPTITPNDRIVFALFLSIIIHMMVIFGVGFSASTPSHKPTTLDVTLTRYKSEKAPTKADYLAQNNQEGSGSEKEKKLLATTEILPYQGDESNPAPVTPASETPINETQKKIISANKQGAATLAATTKKQKTSPKDAPKGKTSLLAHSLEMASLSANLDYHQQALSKMPRVRRLTSLSTMSTADAYYLDSWRRKVEMIGNLNYPEAARQQKLYGSLRLLVTLRANGSIENIEVLESSGHKVLDDAAIRIVKMAAPFAAFTPEMKKNVDKIEIIRTWQFLKNDSLVSG
jgi:protein TonB